MIWQPGEICGLGDRFACDLESIERFDDATRQLFSCYSADLPLLWVSTEVVAKLLDTPMLEFWRTFGFIATPVGCDFSLDLTEYGGNGWATMRMETVSGGRRVAGFGRLSGCRNRGERRP